jgi:transcriptional regulator with XRE-family HTH domain
MAEREGWDLQRQALGAYIRGQRKLADLSLREMSRLAGISNPYLSQVERGLHQPSVRVLKAIAQALDVSAETLLLQAGLLEGDDAADRTTDPGTERAIRSDPRLTPAQQEALIAVYRSYVARSDEGS